MASPKKRDPYAAFPADAPSELVDGYSRLHKAASLDDVDELARLLALPGCDPNIRDILNGLTPLAEAAWSGAASCVDLLLADDRVDVEQADTLGRTPLIFAAEMGHLPILKTLSKVADISRVSTGSHPGNALMAAAGGKNAACVKFLSTLIDPKAKATDGSTALMHAADGGLLACVRFLVPLSDVQATNNKGQNAFMRAALMDRKRAMLELLPTCDPFLQDADGADALALARQAAESRLDADPHSPLMETAVFLVAYTRALKEMSQIAHNAMGQDVASANAASRPRL